MPKETGYGTGTDSFQNFHLNAEGIGRLHIKCSHMSKSRFGIEVEDKNGTTIFAGTFEELIRRLEVQK